jgi:hypothetical protein
MGFGSESNFFAVLKNSSSIGVYDFSTHAVNDSDMQFYSSVERVKVESERLSSRHQEHKKKYCWLFSFKAEEETAP